MSLESDTEEKLFRCAAAKVFLTYSQAGEIKSSKVLIDALKLQGLPIRDYIVGTEEHADGGVHYHAFLKFSKKIDTINPRYFDVNGVHPNIVKNIKSEKAVTEYCMKGGNYISSGIKAAAMFPNSKNFVKAYQDHIAWARFLSEANRKDIEYPIQLPHVDMWINKPVPEERKRHWVIQGPPGCGKTLWLNTVFADRAVYLVPTGSEFRWENYDNEDIVIFDDFRFSPEHEEEIISMTNTWSLQVALPGKQRYYTRYFARGHTRTVLIVCNDIPDFISQPRFATRFNIYNWKENPPTPPRMDLLPPDFLNWDDNPSYENVILPSSPQ